MMSMQSHAAVQSPARSLLDGIQMCLGRPSLSERCRQLTQVLVTRAGSSFAHTGPEGGPLWTAPIKEIHAVFNLLMADVFGSGRGSSKWMEHLLHGSFQTG